jgi:hypothetical protein
MAIKKKNKKRVRVLTLEETTKLLRRLGDVMEADIGSGAETDFLCGEDDDSVQATQWMIRRVADHIRRGDHKGFWRAQYGE